MMNNVVRATAGAPRMMGAGAPAQPGAADFRFELVEVQARAGGVPIDVDEALQGLYQVTQSISNGISKRSDHAGLSEGAATGLGAYIFTAVICVPVAFFSILAIRGGWTEVAEARVRSKVLGTRLAQRQAAREAVHRTIVNADPRAVTAVAREEYIVHDQACDDIVAEQSRNRSTAGIGFSACAAGATMLFRTFADLALQTGLVIAAKGFNIASVLAASPVAAAISAVMGAVGTVVLGPLAGVLATALGGFFVHQSRLGCQRLGKDRRLVRAFLQRQDGLTPSLERYREYILRKVGKRHGFLRRFRNWNAAFLTGGVLFGGTAATKAGIGVAALIGLGAGVLAGPAAVLVLLVIGTVGALMLGVASIPFITQGARNKRHQTQYAGDHRGVDRHSLAPLDLLLAGADGASPAIPVPQGLALRSRLYDSIVQRKGALHTLLGTAASGLGKPLHNRDKPGAFDAGKRIGQVDLKSLGFAHSGLRQRWAACSAFLRALAYGDGFRQARRAASAAYREGAPYERLGNWLGTGPGALAQFVFMRDSLRAQRDFLAAKIATLQQAHVACADVGMFSRASASASTIGAPEAGGQEAAQEAAQEAPNLRRQFAAAIAEDEQTCNAIEALLSELDDNVPVDEGQADALMLRFLALHGRAGESGEVANSRRAFAAFCLEDMPAQLGEMAGVLVATELHAARIRHRNRETILS